MSPESLLSILDSEFSVHDRRKNDTECEKSYVTFMRADFYTMIRAYIEDGVTFAREGDPVNALAAAAYAWGWADAGRMIGLWPWPEGGCRIPARHSPPSFSDNARLIEKTRRYNRILQRACSVVRAAPETGTWGASFGNRLISAALACLDAGTRFCQKGMRRRALFTFSYGHALLDAGIRGGLVGIAGERELFTV